jgi:hypothetical protein
MSDASLPASRAPGFALLATGIASIVLLAFHPMDSATTFADVVKSEAMNQARDGVVHGGDIALLAVEMACFAIFSTRLGLNRAMSVAGLSFFAAGAAAFSASLLIDGLVIPAIAVKSLAVPGQGLATARILFLLCGTLIRFLMPMGLLFQWAGIACWGAAIAQATSRLWGSVCLAIAVCVMAMLVAPTFLPFAAALATSTLPMIVAILGLSLWQLVAGAMMAGRRI